MIGAAKLVRGQLVAMAILLVGCTAGDKAGELPARTLTEQEVVDLLVGGCIQATRACDATGSVERAKEALAQGAEFRLASVQDVPDEGMFVSVAGVGGGGAWEHVIERTEKQGLPQVEDTQVKSVQFLAAHLGTEFRGIFRAEPAGATLTALLTSWRMGLPLLDADMSGRARPEIAQQIPWINGIPATPMALVTRWGDSVIIHSAADDHRAEDLARGVAVASGGGSSIALNPMTGAEVKRGLVPGDLSEAIALGRTVREAREQGRDPVGALTQYAKGYELFRGVVSKSEYRGERGFSWTDATIRGTGKYRGHTYRVWVKNENIVSWLDGNVDVTSPDYIWNLDPATGHAMVSSQLGGYPLGAEVVMVGVPAHQLWRTEKGIEVLGPRHFGFDFDYTPIEELQRKRRVFAQ